MFGFQRVGDLIWAAGDMQARGFLIGGTAGRTTLAGEGLQHQDGHSHLLALPIPNLEAYDPSFAYELATIVREGLRRMYEAQEDVFYYLTIENENLPQPAAPEHLSREELIEGILAGLYRYAPSSRRFRTKAQLFGSGAIMGEVLKAQAILEDYKVAADVWSVTSYKALHNDAVAVARRNRLRGDGEAETPYLRRALDGAEGPFVAASDYVKALPDMLAPYLPRPMVSLGTDGFGRSEAREELRDFFEVDAKHIAHATLRALVDDGELEPEVLERATDELGIDASKPDPARS
jgi:pyruvate dehydrogenase E1 component